MPSQGLVLCGRACSVQWLLGHLLLPCADVQGWEQLVDSGYKLRWREGSWAAMPVAAWSPRLSHVPVCHPSAVPAGGSC